MRSLLNRSMWRQYVRTAQEDVLKIKIDMVRIENATRSNTDVLTEMN